MAVEVNYLNPGTRSLDDANWLKADGTAGAGFAGDGALGTQLVIDRGDQSVDQNVMDKSAVTPSPEYFEVRPGFTGNFGSSTNPAKFSCAGTAESLVNRTSRFVWNPGAGKGWYHGNASCLICEVCNAELNLVGGDFKHLRLQAGAFLDFSSVATAAASGVFGLMGGRSRFHAHATDLLVTTNIMDGEHEFLRAGATFNVYGGQNTFDVKNSSVTTLNQFAGETILKSHNATGPALTAFGGVIDLSQLGRPITFTDAVLGNVRFIGYKKALVTFTNPVIHGTGPIGLN